MALKKPVKIALCIFSAPILIWGTASLYFTIAGRDLPDICFDKYIPPPQNLKPEENAYTAIKEFAENRTTNNTLLFKNYRLRKAYLNGTTNRLALADEARAFIAAESNTITVVKRILGSKGIEIPFEEVLTANVHICSLQRITHIYMVKATYEAANGDIAAGRRSLMDAYEVGRFLQSHTSLLSGMSLIITHVTCAGALAAARNQLFAPYEDENWRKQLQKLHLEICDENAEDAKNAARMNLVGFSRATARTYASNMSPKTISEEYLKSAVLDLIQPNSSSLRLKTWAQARFFITPLATICPGYVQYSIQPNRSLDTIQTSLDEFCRKIDEPGYDVKYANDSCDSETGFFSRNWLGERIFSSHRHNEWYRLTFRMRFGKIAQATLFACRSYKAKYGKYPETLSALIPEFLPEVPRDPYEGCELRYNAKEGFIWTRGEKLSFNGVVQTSRTNKPYFRNNDDRRSVVFLDEP